MSSAPPPSFPAPAPRYDPRNEAAFRAAVDRIIQDAVQRIYALIREGPAGQIALGQPATLDGASEGDVVLANAAVLRAANAAGNTTIALIVLTPGDDVLIGATDGSLQVRSADLGAAQTVTAGANDSGGTGFRTLLIPNA